MTNNYGEMQNIYLGTDNARLGSTTAERPKWSDEHILALKRAAADIQDIRENLADLRDRLGVPLGDAASRPTIIRDKVPR